jgi:hypothetical protein
MPPAPLACEPSSPPSARVGDGDGDVPVLSVALGGGEVVAAGVAIADAVPVADAAPLAVAAPLAAAVPLGEAPACGDASRRSASRSPRRCGAPALARATGGCEPFKSGWVREGVSGGCADAHSCYRNGRG